MKVQKLQKQQAVNTGLLQHTAANVQNIANNSPAHQVQLSSSVCNQLDNITKILKANFALIDEDLKKPFYNKKLIHKIMETYNLAFEQRFTGIEAQLVRLRMQAETPIVQSSQLPGVQHYILLLLEQEAAAAQPPPLPVPPLSRHIYSVTPSTAAQRYQHYYLEMVASKVPPPSKFCADMKNLEGWIL